MKQGRLVNGSERPLFSRLINLVLATFMRTVSYTKDATSVVTLRSQATEASMAWNDERVVLLKKYWADGLSAPQIAGKLGGVTRNAVAGKVQRLGLQGRAAPASLRDFSNAIKAFDADTHKEIQRLTEVFSEGVSDDAGPSLLKIARGQCCWPLGDPFTDDFHYCGQSTAGGQGSYCAFHAKRAFQPARRRSHTQQSATGNPASR